MNIQIELSPEELRNIIYACESMELVNATIKSKAMDGLKTPLNLTKLFSMAEEQSNRKYEVISKKLKKQYDDWNNNE